METGLMPAVRQALLLLISGDAELWAIIAISFSVSLRAMAVVTPFSLLLAFFLAHAAFPGRRFLITILNSLQAVPAVAVGLLVYLLLSRQGVFGSFRLLFTQSAMVIAQVILCFPLLTAMNHAAMQAADRRIWETAITLGARPWQAMLTLMYEVRFGLGAAFIAGFGRIIAEVGCSMMVGGNILGVTRNIPTAIALETSKGAFSQGIALGLVLLLLSLVVNMVLHLLQGRGEVRP